MDTNKTIRNVLLTVPGMLLCLIGDYCIGLEPKGSKEIGLLASDGWLTISDLRIGISNTCGMVGTFLFGIAVYSLISYLRETNKNNTNKWDNIFLKSFYFSLCTGCISFIYFHIACGKLIQSFNVLYDVTGGDIKTSESALLRLFATEAIPFVLLLILFDLVATVSWIALVLRKQLKLGKAWILAAPLISTLIGEILEFLPLPFGGISSGTETLGWMFMFIGAALHIKRSKQQADTDKAATTNL